MTTIRRSLVVAIATTSLVSTLPRPVLAGPVIIRDELISDTSLTPSVGRGYSIATNTFQSTCMDKMERTQPSFDFVYSFKQLSATGSGKPDMVVSAQGAANISPDPAPATNANADAEDPTKAKGAVRFYMQAAIDMVSYYASIDEAKSTLAPSAIGILKKRDLPGFFDSCGVYYVRSVQRKSTYLSIFSYESQTLVREDR